MQTRPFPTLLMASFNVVLVAAVLASSAARSCAQVQTPSAEASGRGLPAVPDTSSPRWPRRTLLADSSGNSSSASNGGSSSSSGNSSGSSSSGSSSSDTVVVVALVVALAVSVLVSMGATVVACMLWKRLPPRRPGESSGASGAAVTSSVAPEEELRAQGAGGGGGGSSSKGGEDRGKGKGKEAATSEAGGRRGRGGRVGSGEVREGDGVEEEEERRGEEGGDEEEEDRRQQLRRLKKEEQQRQQQQQEEVVRAKAEQQQQQVRPEPDDPGSGGGTGTFDIQKVVSFPLKVLVDATNTFASGNHLGQGTYGMVYKAKLPSGDVVAVKRAKADRKQDAGKFRKEIELLSRVSHKNLVRLVGYCREGGEQLLVYEYVAGGNLSQNLNPTWRERHSRPPLNWTERLLIAAGTARGLAYLHEEINVPFIHRDVKPSNIMIDRHVVAKIADFGTTKPMTPEELRKMSVTIQGTAGYCDPDYLRTGHSSKRIDVYSLGIVLLELLTGKGPHKVNRPYRFDHRSTPHHTTPRVLAGHRAARTAHRQGPAQSQPPLPIRCETMRDREISLSPSPILPLPPQVKDRFDRGGLPGIEDPTMGLYPAHKLHHVFDLALRCTALNCFSLSLSLPPSFPQPFQQVKYWFDRGGLPSIVDPTMGLYPTDQLPASCDLPFPALFLVLFCIATSYTTCLTLPCTAPHSTASNISISPFSPSLPQVKDRFDRGGLPSIVDPTMGLYPADELHHVFDLALRCTDIQNPAARPSMSRVVAELEAVLEPEAISRFISSGPPSHDSADFRAAPSGSGAGPGGAGLTRFAGAGKQVGQGGVEGGPGSAAAGSGVAGLAVGGTAGAALAAAISSASPSRADDAGSTHTPDPLNPPNCSQPQLTPPSDAPIPPPSSRRTPGPPAYKGRAAGAAGAAGAAAGAAEATGGDIRGVRDRDYDGAYVPAGQNDPRIDPRSSGGGGAYVVSHDVGIQMKPAPVAALRGASAAVGGGATGAGVTVAGVAGGNAGGISGGIGVAAPPTGQPYEAGERFDEGGGGDGGERGGEGYEEGLDVSFDSSGFDRSGVFSYGAMPPA
ncbi:unnamed protein product [Closterium sp. NIES-54]